MDRWRRGERHAASVLLARYLPRAHAFFRRRVVEHADDLTQRVAETCLRYEARVLACNEFGLYFSAVVRHTLSAHFRRAGPRLTSLGIDPGLPREADHPDDRLVSTRLRRAVRNALENVHPDLRQVMTLKFAEDLSGRELAARLGIPEGTVRSRLRRGYAHMRQVLDPGPLRG